MTIAARPSLELSSLDDYDHLVLEHVSWGFYERLLREIDYRNLRVTYDQGRLEIMSPLPEHERPSRQIQMFLTILTMELNIPICSLGSTTFKRKELAKGLEPDSCFYVQHEARIRGKKRWNPRRDPPPDLALEVEITRRSIPKLPIYAALRVPEVWRYDGEALTCLHLRRGKYSAAEKSRAFPFLRVSDLEPFLRRLDTDDETTVMRAFRDWVRRTFPAAP